MTTTLPPGPPFSLSGLFETRSYVVPVANYPGQEGGALLTPPTQCFAFGPAGNGGSRWIRTTSLGYEPSELPLLHHCDIGMYSKVE